MKKTKATMELMIFFINHKDQELLSEILTKRESIMQIACNGKAIADTDISEFWGFGLVERKILFAIVPISDVQEILDEAYKKLKLDKKHNGLAFSVPLQSATTSLLSKFVKEKKNENKN